MQADKRWVRALLLFLLPLACGGGEALLPVPADRPADPGVALVPLPNIPVRVDPIATPPVEVVLEDPEAEPHSNPLVLVHGFLATGTSLGFADIGADLRARGFTVAVADLSASAAPPERAGQLAHLVDAVLLESGARRVNIIAHSAGGLDARYLISTLGYGDRVASLSTVATPHRGSAVADRIFALTRDTPDPLLEAFARIWGLTVGDIDDDPDLRAALAALRTEDAAEFNAANPDDPRVLYRSWAGLSDPLARPDAGDDPACEHRLLFDPSVRDRLNPLFDVTAWWAGEGVSRLPNDGMVTVESAKWGEFVGCLAADHADEIGALDQPSPDPVTGFDHLALYRAIADDLVGRGL